MIDDLSLDEIYDYDSEEKERADREIEALERKEQKENEREKIIERQVDELARVIGAEMVLMNLMNRSLKKIHEIMGLPKA